MHARSASSPPTLTGLWMEAICMQGLHRHAPPPFPPLTDLDGCAVHGHLVTVILLHPIKVDVGRVHHLDVKGVVGVGRLEGVLQVVQGLGYSS